MRLICAITPRARGTAVMLACMLPGQPGFADVGHDDPYASTYVPRAHAPFVIRHATVLTADDRRLDDYDVLVRNGRIVALGQSLAAGDAESIDATHHWLTPGIIDIHSHIGDSPAPEDPATADYDEISAPVVAEVWAEHSVWPQDPQFPLALAGGMTTMQILPGSGNLIGGLSVVVKNVPARTVYEMKFPDAPAGLKMACGENPKREFGEERKVAPTSRMGNIALTRAAFAKAQEYRDKWRRYEDATRAGHAGSKDATDRPERDLALDTLSKVLEGKVLVHNHCYRADEMAVMMNLAKEFGFRIAAFHHAVEAYKVADLLAANQVCAALWTDWFGFKFEANDGIQENLALVDHAGACAMLHSDSPRTAQRMNQEAAKAMARARQLGFAVDQAHAIGWITSRPAQALGIGDRVGRIAENMNADLVLWDRDPFSVYAKAERVWIDGYLYYDRNDPTRQPVTDFDLGNTPQGGR